MSNIEREPNGGDAMHEPPVGIPAYAEKGRFVARSGLRLAVFEYEDTPEAAEDARDKPGAGAARASGAAADAPTVLFVHGYPDSHVVWDEVRAELGPGLRAVCYDVRGAGDSEPPRRTSGYRMTELADDLFAVADAVSPNRPVHVVGHDWGSIQAWQAVTDPRAEQRIASFTSVSGPCLDHTAYWFRERLRRPSPRGGVQLLRQGSKSWYIYAFHIPFAPKLLWRFWMAKAWPGLLQRAEGVESAGRRPQPTLERDATRGIGLYRANMLPRLLHPEPRYARIPVQLISPLRDRFVSPALAEGLERWAPDLRRHALPCGHWGALTRKAPELAKLITDFVTEVEQTRAQADAAESQDR